MLRDGLRKVCQLTNSAGKSLLGATCSVTPHMLFFISMFSIDGFVTIMSFGTKCTHGNQRVHPIRRRSRPPCHISTRKGCTHPSRSETVRTEGKNVSGHFGSSGLQSKATNQYMSTAWGQQSRNEEERKINK